MTIKKRDGFEDFFFSKEIKQIALMNFLLIAPICWPADRSFYKIIYAWWGHGSKKSKLFIPLG
jgi:hypothetical protein